MKKENKEIINRFKKMGVKHKLAEGFCDICMQKTIFQNTGDGWRCTHASKAHDDYKEKMAKKELKKILKM